MRIGAPPDTSGYHPCQSGGVGVRYDARTLRPALRCSACPPIPAGHAAERHPPPPVGIAPRCRWRASTVLHLLSDLLQCNAGESGQEGMTGCFRAHHRRTNKRPGGFVGRFPARRFARVQHDQEGKAGHLNAQCCAGSAAIGSQVGVDRAHRSARIGMNPAMIDVQLEGGNQQLKGE